MSIIQDYVRLCCREKNVLTEKEKSVLSQWQQDVLAVARTSENLAMVAEKTGRDYGSTKQTLLRIREKGVHIRMGTIVTD